MIARLARPRLLALAALLLCFLGGEVRAQHVVTPEEANKLTFDSLVGGGGGGGGGGASRHTWHRPYAGAGHYRHGRYVGRHHGRAGGRHYRYAPAHGARGHQAARPYHAAPVHTGRKYVANHGPAGSARSVGQHARPPLHHSGR